MSHARYGRRRALAAIGATLATVATAGCSSGGSSGPRTVEMPGGLAFDPDTVRVDAGATVRWVNESGISHTVTAYADELPDGAAYFASGGFDSERAARDDVQGGFVAPDDAYEHTFEQAGTYGYFCIPHEGAGMVGTVNVE